MSSRAKRTQEYDYRKSAVIAGMLLYNEQIDAANFTGVAIVLVSIIIMMKAE